VIVIGSIDGFLKMVDEESNRFFGFDLDSSENGADKVEIVVNNQIFWVESNVLHGF